MKYIERQSGEVKQFADITHWIIGEPSTTMSIAEDEMLGGQLIHHPCHNSTPAILFGGVYYLLDQGE